MPPDGKTEFGMWRQRLEDAQRIWREKGIVGTRGDSTMRMLIEFYRSNQWASMLNWGGLPPEQLRVVNKIFPTANAQQARVASRNPKTSYFPRPRKGGQVTAELEAKARAVKALHDYDIREQRHKIDFNAAFRDHQFAPFGVLRHGYTPLEEMDTDDGRRKRQRRIDRRNRNPNAPWVRRYAPWNVLMDPYCDFFHVDGGMRWIAFRDGMWKQDILDNPGMTVDRDKLRKSSGNVSREWMEMQDPALRHHRGAESDAAFEVWTVYEDETRTWFQLALSGFDDWIRKPDDWQIPWETLPANVLSVNHQMDTPFALSLMEDLIPLQQELNQVRTMIHQAVLRTRRFNLVATGQMEDESATRMKNGDMGEFFYVTGNDASKSVHTVQSTGLPQESLQLLGVVEEDMRESNGQSKMDRAQRVNVESATEAAFINTGSAVQEGRVEDAFVDFVTEAESLYMQGRRHILRELDATEVVQIVGEGQRGKIREWVEVTPEDLHGEWEFELEAGSTRRKSPDDEARKALADLSVAMNPALQGVANIAYWYRRYIEARGMDPSEGISPQAYELAQISQTFDVAERLDQLRQGQASSPPLQPLDPNLMQAFGSGNAGGSA